MYVFTKAVPTRKNALQLHTDLSRGNKQSLICLYVGLEQYKLDHLF
jgi:hypothetical protein